MILDNGVIRTLDPSLPTARALAIAGDRIAGGVGTHETALASPDVVDLRGRCVLPGFADAHVHFPSWALAASDLRLEPARSLEDALDLVAAALPNVPPGGWLRGTGWRDSDWTTPPTRAALDRITGSTPTLLVAKDGHSLWLNSAALDHANGDLGDNVVERDTRGEPTGVLREHAAWRFRQAHGTPAEDETLAAMRTGLRVAAAAGITSIHDIDLGDGTLPLWQRLREHAWLRVRVWHTLPHSRLGSLTELGLQSGFGDELLRLGHLKVFLDGTLGSQTARLLDGSGVELTSRADLEDIIREAAAAGFPIAVHAIGDAANRDALDAFEATREDWASRGLRQRVEHAQCVAPADLPRFAELGVAASVQFSHATSDRDLVERFWPDRLESAYPFRSLVDSGALVANGSDAPVEALDPWAGVCAAVLRTVDGRPPWRPEQALTLEQTLAATCVAPAWLSGDEHRRGRLLPGFLADLVVLDRDPFTVEPAQLAEIRVVATMVGGRWTHHAPPWD